MQSTKAISYANLFTFLFLSINLHNFQRLSILYLLIPFGIYFLLCFSLDVIDTRINISNSIFIIYLSYIFYSIYLVIYSIPTSGSEIAIGTVRYFFTPLLALFAVNSINTENHISKLIDLYIFIIFISAMTIPLQFIVGPISWFAESATRGGAYRFSTLLGNLTAIGISGGVGLTLALLHKGKNNFIRYLFIFGIVLGMSMSMQRAGVMNILFSLLIYFFLSAGKWTNKLKQLIFTFSIAGILFLVAYNIDFFKIYLSFFMNSLGLDSGISTRVDYTPFYEQIIYRLSGNTLSHFNYYGPVWLTVGYGLSAFGGVLGMKGLYAHNDFLNVLTVGGIVYLSLFILFLVSVFSKNIKYYKISKRPDSKNNLRSLMGALIIFIINLPMGSGNYFHPNHSIIFWLTVGVFSGHYFNKYSKKLL